MACVGGLLSSSSQRLPYSKAKLSSYSPLSSRKRLGLGLGLGQFASVIRAETMATEKLGIKIERNPLESKLTQLGVRKWPKWGCPPSKFPWTFDSKETCYLLEGKVKVTPDGSAESVEIGAGDLVEFPKGMSCTWDVSVAVDKHYNLA